MSFEKNVFTFPQPQESSDSAVDEVAIDDLLQEVTAILQDHQVPGEVDTQEAWERVYAADQAGIQATLDALDAMDKSQWSAKKRVAAIQFKKKLQDIQVQAGRNIKNDRKTAA